MYAANILSSWASISVWLLPTWFRFFFLKTRERRKKFPSIWWDFDFWNGEGGSMGASSFFLVSRWKSSFFQLTIWTNQLFQLFSTCNSTFNWLEVNFFNFFLTFPQLFATCNSTFNWLEFNFQIDLQVTFPTFCNFRSTCKSYFSNHLIF